MRVRFVGTPRSAIFVVVSIASLFAGAAGAQAAEDAPKRPEERPPSPTKVDVGTALFVAGAGVGIGGRWIGYTDLVVENLRTYGVFGAPLAAFHAEVFPWARQGTAILKDLGLSIRYAGALGLDSSLPDGTGVGTSWHRFEAALRARQTLGRGPRGVVVGASVGYTFESFTFDATGAVGAEAPSVTYHGVRFAGDGRAPLGPVALLFGLGYRLPVAAGALLARFRDGSVGGVDASLGLAVPTPLAGIEARAGAQYTRYFYSFFPEPGDPYIAGGALDEFLVFEIGAAYVH